MIYFVPFSNIITISLPGFLSVQSALVGPVDEQQGRLQKRYDPRERGPHSFYLLGQYNCLRESERWLDWLCVHVILWFLFFFLSQFGEDHSQTRCSKDFLCTITKEAVKVERSLRQAGADCTEQTVEVLCAQELMRSPISPTSDSYKQKGKVCLLIFVFPLSSVSISHNWHCAGANGSGNGDQEDYTKVNIHFNILWYHMM